MPLRERSTLGFDESKKLKHSAALLPYCLASFSCHGAALKTLSVARKALLNTIKLVNLARFDAENTGSNNRKEYIIK